MFLLGALICEISIHAPREGSDGWGHHHPQTVPDFYPRSPRGERLDRHRAGRGIDAISIHAPREGSDDGPAGRRRRGIPISIHAPREGSDSDHQRQHLGRLYFYPRSPRGERLVSPIFARYWNRFLSTLPARGATSIFGGWATTRTNFYPRSPRGERRRSKQMIEWINPISIHAPREGSDWAP